MINLFQILWSTMAVWRDISVWLKEESFSSVAVPYHFCNCFNQSKKAFAPRYSIKTFFQKNLQDSHQRTYTRVSTYNFIKKRLRQRCFLWILRCLTALFSGTLSGAFLPRSCVALLKTYMCQASVTLNSSLVSLSNNLCLLISVKILKKSIWISSELVGWSVMHL